MKALAKLAEGKCRPCAAGARPLGVKRVEAHLRMLPGWKVVEGELTKTFQFENYYGTMAFVNATAWVSHQEDHHPDLEVGYNKCRVRYSTHSIGGLSENDFICAAKVEQLGG